ncbi:hypothetical protein AB4068_15610 [Arthrobacter sp. 2RAF22]|uniref:hypothetical protein n=1 Tax=Arthrobacter sp. 2RAF22 TaxID=3232996 RepID=UPI003F8E8A31
METIPLDPGPRKPLIALAWLIGFFLTGCTGNCGSLTYTFSRPVKSPVLHVGDMGAAMAGLVNGVVPFCWSAQS